MFELNFGCITITTASYESYPFPDLFTNTDPKLIGCRLPSPIIDMFRSPKVCLCLCFVWWRKDVMVSRAVWLCIVLLLVKYRPIIISAYKCHQTIIFSERRVVRITIWRVYLKPEIRLISEYNLAIKMII